MDRLIYTSLGSITNQSAVRAQITNNLANVSTVGFKESFALASQSSDVEGEGFNSRSSVKMNMEDIIDLKPGVSNRTGRAMDIALQDKTVLGVQAQDGEIAFTRRGDLRVSPTGLIENAAGHLILGEAGPINVPPGQMVTISPDGAVFGSLPSEPETPPVRLGTLLLRDASETPLTRRTDGLFEPLNQELRGIDFPTGPLPVSLQSGSLEGSNVNPIEAMVNLMDFSRSYESQIKMIKEIKSIDENGASMMRVQS
jgi:flagellar basal-body rod protein FlgF